MNTTSALNDKVIPLLKKLIQNACVNEGIPESGNEYKSAKVLCDFFESYGLEPEILEKQAGRSNVFLRIPGTDPFAPSLMYMGHLDVVPADSKDWEFDPFSGEISEGYIYGRGTVDMLNLVAVQAVAIAEYYKNRGPARGDLLFLAVADEENTGTFGARWLVSNHWNKVRSDYVISELGGLFLENGSNKITLASGEKGIAWVRISSRGIPGHGSMPYHSDNVAVKLAKITKILGENNPKAVIHDSYRNMVNEIIPSKSLRKALKSPFRIEKALNNLYKKDRGTAKFLHSSSHMTVSPNLFRAGDNINTIPESGFIDVDIRILPGQTVEDVQLWLQKILKEMIGEISIEFLEFFPSNLSKTDTKLMKAIKEQTKTIYPDCAVAPSYLGSVSDGRFWRNKGSVVYGYALFDKEMTVNAFSNRIHGIDEKISIDSLRKSLSFFYRIPERLFSEK